MASRVSRITESHGALAFPQMQLETEKERVSLLETLLQTQKELADASQQLERLRQDMKIQKLKEQVWSRPGSDPSASTSSVRGLQLWT